MMSTGGLYVLAQEAEPDTDVTPASVSPAVPNAVTNDVAAQETPDEAPVDIIGFEEAETLPFEEPEETRHEALISITLDDVPLVDVIRMFTRISGANIIANAENLQGNVTVNLTDVQWRPALASILDMHDLALVEKEPGSRVYSVVMRPPNAPEPMLTRTFELHFATVSDVTPVIEPMLPEGGSVTEFPQRNILVVRSTSENLSEVQKLIEAVDAPTKQVCIETKFLELSDSATKKLGIRWDSLDEFGIRAQAGPFSRSKTVEKNKTREDTLDRFDHRQNTDTIHNRYDLYNSPYEIESIDIVERPDGTFVELENLEPTREVTDTIDTGQNVDSEIVESFSQAIQESQAAILELGSFELLLSALKKTDGVSIISNPKIVVANGATNALFSVGEREPIIRTEVVRGTTESPGDKVTSQLDTSLNTAYIQQGYLQTGIDLRVIPVVKTDDLIEARIQPKLIRRLLPDKTVGDNSWPRISVKEIRTKFTLRSGQTVAIGGLTDNRDNKNVTKIPFLGDLPLVGKYLFSHTEDVTEQVETIIFVTLSLASPEVIEEDVGIPTDAQLVHKRRIKAAAARQEFERELQQIEDAQQAQESARSGRIQSELLKRRD